MDEVSTLSNGAPLVINEEKEVEREMELVDPSEFEGKVSVEVTDSDLEEIYALAQEMVKFAHARGGVGLTLPQIGINKRAFVMLDKEDQWVMIINPEFFGTGKKATVYERSLSYEDVYWLKRFKKINAVYYTLDVKDEKLLLKKNYRMMSGLRAFVFQNLVDMLNGKTGRTNGSYCKPLPKEEKEE